MGGGAPVLRKGREVSVVVRDEAGNGAGLLIVGVRRFGGRYFELEKPLRPTMAVGWMQRCGQDLTGRGGGGRAGRRGAAVGRGGAVRRTRRLGQAH
jgi:hypothetical protein